MGVRKRSVALDEEVAHDVVRAAAEDKVSVSAWLCEAARERLRIRRGLRGVAAWEAKAGKLSPQEIAAGEALLDRLSLRRTRPHAGARDDHRLTEVLVPAIYPNVAFS